jgi:type IV pilus assembly protein PilM
MVSQLGYDFLLSMVVNRMELLNGNNRRVSIIVKDHVIRFVEQLKPNVFHSFGEKRLPSGIIRAGNIIERETLVMILEECIENWRIKSVRTLFCVPDSSYVIRKTTVPSHVPDDEVKGELYFELDEKLHLPFTDAVLEACVVGELNQEKTVIVVASPEKTISDYQSLFEEVKLKPVVADVSSLSMYRLFYSLDLANSIDHFLLIQINLDSINMTIFHQDIPVFTRHLQVFFDEKLWETTTNRSGLLTWTFIGENQQLASQVQDFSLELERIINFYHFSVHKGVVQVTKVVMTGDHPHLDWYTAKCKEAITVPITTIPETLFKTQSNQNIPSRFYEAIGLSLHGQMD